MLPKVKIIVGDDSTRAAVLINGRHVESIICKYALEQAAGDTPVLHLYIPVLKADIEIADCEVEEHEINFGI